MKKNTFSLTILLAIMAFFLIFSAEKSRSQNKYIHTIAPGEVQDLLKAMDNYILVDVRTEEEYQQGHLTGAVLIPYDEVYETAKLKLPDKNAAVLIYCRSGRRSAIAAEILMQMGYVEIYDIGGLINWDFNPPLESH